MRIGSQIPNPKSQIPNPDEIDINQIGIRNDPNCCEILEQSKKRDVRGGRRVGSTLRHLQTTIAVTGEERGPMK